MAKRCEICKEIIEEEFGKLKGSMLRLVDDKKSRYIYVCSTCQKDPRHIEKAKVKGA